MRQAGGDPAMVQAVSRSGGSSSTGGKWFAQVQTAWEGSSVGASLLHGHTQRRIMHDFAIQSRQDRG